jgi:hypothetical protein
MMTMDEQKQYEVLATQALEAKRLRDEGLTGMAAQIEELIEKRLGEIVYATGFPLTIRDVKEAARYASCADCKGTGAIGQPCKCIKSDGKLPSDRRYHRGRCEAGGVKYCACPLGAERYEADRVSTTNIIAPITREWRFFPADQYGTPEFLRLCTDQAKEQRAAGRLAIAAALERYVESKR